MLWSLGSPFIPSAQQRSLSAALWMQRVSPWGAETSPCAHPTLGTLRFQPQKGTPGTRDTQIKPQKSSLTSTTVVVPHSNKYTLYPQERTQNFWLQLIKSRVSHFLQHNYLLIVYSVYFLWHNRASQDVLSFFLSFLNHTSFFSAAAVNSRCTAANSLLGMCFSYQPSTSNCLKLPLLLVWQFISLGFAILGSEFGPEPRELTLGWDTEFKFVNLTRTAL